MAMEVNSGFVVRFMLKIEMRGELRSGVCWQFRYSKLPCNGEKLGSFWGQVNHLLGSIHWAPDTADVCGCIPIPLS